MKSKTDTSPTKVRKPKKTPKKLSKKLNTDSPLSEITADDLNTEIQNRIKSTRLSNNEIKFIQNNGLNQNVLKNFLQIQSSNFESTLTPNQLIDYSLIDSINNNLYNLYSINYYNELNEPELIEFNDNSLLNFNFNFQNQLEFKFNDNESINLLSNNLVNFPLNENNLRHGLVFNTGGLPVTMEWCPLEFNNKKYLFVSLVDKNSKLSEFSNDKSILTIFEIGSNNNLNDLNLKINKRIILNSIIKEIEFSFISLNNNSSLLKLTLSNGEIEIWKITNNFFTNNNLQNKFYKINSGILKFKIPNKNMLITTSTFISSNHLIFGTNHGYIGQFTINPIKLNYLIYMNLPAITNIKILLPTNSKENSINSLISSSDFFNYLVKLPLPNKDQNCILNNLKLFEMSCMNKELTFDKNIINLNYLKNFLVIENNSTIRQINCDDPNNGKKIRILNDDEINCLTSQISYNNSINNLKILNINNLLLTGHTNGSIRLSNYLNFLSIGERKNTSSTIKIMQLHQSKNNNNKYWLDLNYYIDKIGEIKNPISTNKDNIKPIGRIKDIRTINPNQICPLKISMLDNLIVSSWGNGLIIIEDITL